MTLSVGNRAGALRCRGLLFRGSPCDSDISRHTFLQQKLRRSHDRFGVKSRAHPAFLKCVRDADYGHCLMMGHVGADDSDLRPSWQAARSVVQRLIPAVDAAGPNVGHAFEIAGCRGGIDHGR